MNHTVSLSGGLSSAVAADRVIQRFGRDVTIWFADTRWEDDDLYRFLADLERHWGMPIQRASDGRTPLQVAEDHHIIPNNRLAVCSEELKVWQREKYLKTVEKPVTLYIGYDWSEMHRVTKMQRYDQGDGVTIDFPLLWHPYEMRPYDEVVRSWGIEPPRLYALGFSHNNCFSGDTRFITSRGVRTLRETEGQVVQVLGFGGGWKSALVRSFGEQLLWRLTLRRHAQTKEVWTTADHRWFRRHGRTSRDEVLTRDLQSGDYLASMYGRLGTTVRPSAYGIAHGIVFGDGTHPAEGLVRNPASVVLCGDKDRQLLRWFPLSPKSEVPNVGIRVSDLPRTWKLAPSLDESQSYLYGWLAGYFAADGTVTNGEFRLSSAHREHLELAREVAFRIGLATNPISSYERLGLGSDATSLFSMTFMPSTLRADFFLIEDHLSRFAATSHNRPVDWRVEAIEETDRREEVYCATVPDGGVFTLEDNLLTGNCGGRCVRQGVSDWLRLLRTFPDRYEGVEQWEQEQRAKGGARASWAICRDRSGGQTRPITLQEIRERAEELEAMQPTLIERRENCICTA